MYVKPHIVSSAAACYATEQGNALIEPGTFGSHLVRQQSLARIVF